MIGKLKPTAYHMYKHDFQWLPPHVSCGDPFYEEESIYSYKDLILSGLDYLLCYDGTHLSSVKITLAEDFYPSLISLKERGRVIAEYKALPGGRIEEKDIILETDTSAQRLELYINSNFTDIDIYNIEFFGISGEAEEEMYPSPKSIIKRGEYVDVPKLTEEKYDPDLDGYTVTVNEEKISIVYSEKLYLNMARSRIENLIKDGKIPAIEFFDTPFCKFRGVHLYMPAEEDFPFFKKLVKEILVPLGYNHIILEICGSMEFTSHPEINESYLLAKKNAEEGIWPPLPHGSVASGTVVPKAKVRELVSFCRDLGIEVIPEIQSLGHVQFMTLAHPEIAEIPVTVQKKKKVDVRLQDVPPDEFYAHSYCPSNEKTYEILFDLMEEIIETFEPKEYVHMGHDEVYQIGKCAVCKASGKKPAELYLEDVMRIYSFLKEKNLKMMLWSDMVNPESDYRTRAALDKLPTDIVLMDFIWYFHLDKDVEKPLTRKGFDVIIGNLYSSLFPRFESRIRRNRILGGEVSAWTKTNEYCMQREGKLYDIIYTAQMLWSESYREECRRSYDHIIRPLITKMRNKIQGIPQLTQSEKLFEGKVRDVTVAVNKKFTALAFTHTSLLHFTKLPWEDGKLLGNYIVEYDDGETETVPVRNGHNVYYSKVRQNAPIRHSYFRHTGYVGTWATDEVIIDHETFYKYTWLNPHPEKTIKSVALVTENITVFNADHLILGKMEGLN